MSLGTLKFFGDHHSPLGLMKSRVPVLAGRLIVWMNYHILGVRERDCYSRNSPVNFIELLLLRARISHRAVPLNSQELLSTQARYVNPFLEARGLVK